MGKAFGVEAFAEFDQGYWGKRLCQLVFFEANEVLQIRILGDLLHEFTVSVTATCLYDKRPQGHAHRFSNIPSIAWKHEGIFFFDFVPGYDFCQTNPTIICAEAAGEWQDEIVYCHLQAWLFVHLFASRCTVFVAQLLFSMHLYSTKTPANPCGYYISKGC